MNEFKKAYLGTLRALEAVPQRMTIRIPKMWAVRRSMPSSADYSEGRHLLRGFQGEWQAQSCRLLGRRRRPPRIKLRRKMPKWIFSPTSNRLINTIQTVNFVLYIESKAHKGWNSIWSHCIFFGHSTHSNADCRASAFCVGNAAPESEANGEFFGKVRPSHWRTHLTYRWQNECILFGKIKGKGRKAWLVKNESC